MFFQLQKFQLTENSSWKDACLSGDETNGKANKGNISLVCDIACPLIESIYVFNTCIFSFAACSF